MLNADQKRQLNAVLASMLGEHPYLLALAADNEGFAIVECDRMSDREAAICYSDLVLTVMRVGDNLAARSGQEAVFRAAVDKLVRNGRKNQSITERPLEK